MPRKVEHMGGSWYRVGGERGEKYQGKEAAAEAAGYDDVESMESHIIDASGQSPDFDRTDPDEQDVRTETRAPLVEEPARGEDAPVQERVDSSAPGTTPDPTLTSPLDRERQKRAEKQREAHDETPKGPEAVKEWKGEAKQYIPMGKQEEPPDIIQHQRVGEMNEMTASDNDEDTAVTRHRARMAQKKRERARANLLGDGGKVEEAVEVEK